MPASGCVVGNRCFVAAFNNFTALGHASINPNLANTAVGEMGGTPPQLATLVRQDEVRNFFVGDRDGSGRGLERVDLAGDVHLAHMGEVATAGLTTIKSSGVLSPPTGRAGIQARCLQLRFRQNSWGCCRGHRAEANLRFGGCICLTWLGAGALIGPALGRNENAFTQCQIPRDPRRPRAVPPRRLHVDRTAGGDRDHRAAGSPPVAGIEPGQA